MATSALVFAVFASACGADSPTEAIGCDPAAVADTVGSGMPTFDYEPAGSLAALLDRTDLVITGTFASVQRVEGEPSSLTQITVKDYDVLSSVDEATTQAFAADPVLTMATVWADGGADPLGNRRNFGPADTHFIAFVWTSDESSFFVPDIEGLHIACGLDDTTTPVIVDFPSVTGLSLTELVDQVRT